MFPKLKKTISKFLFNEDGKIVVKPMIKIATIVSLASLALANNVTVKAYNGNADHANHTIGDYPTDCHAPNGFPGQVLKQTHVGEYIWQHADESSDIHDEAHCSDGNAPDGDDCDGNGGSILVTNWHNAFHHNSLDIQKVNDYQLKTTHSHALADCEGKEHSSCWGNCYADGSEDKHGSCCPREPIPGLHDEPL